MLTDCLDKDSSQTPISLAATLTPGALLCGHYISHDAEAVHHPQHVPVTGSSALHVSTLGPRLIEVNIWNFTIHSGRRT